MYCVHSDRVVLLFTAADTNSESGLSDRVVSPIIFPNFLVFILEDKKIQVSELEKSPSETPTIVCVYTSIT